jgi:hypothetical protein
MVRFEIPCVLPFSREDFWRLRSCPSFLAFIVSDGLLKSLEATQPTVGADGWATREQTYVPANVDCPAVVRAVVGETRFGVTDIQRWNDVEAPFVQEFAIRPSFLSALSRTWGTLTVEDVGDGDVALDVVAAEAYDEAEDEGYGYGGEDESTRSTASAGASTEGDGDADDDDFNGERCKHTVRGEARVSILTVGWFVERAIIHNLRLFYNEYPKSVARFRTRIVNEYANGDASIDISVVVDRLLAADMKRQAEFAAQKLAKANVVGLSEDDRNGSACGSSSDDVLSDSDDYSVDYGAVEEDELC